jgi:hypothetical protein
MFKRLSGRISVAAAVLSAMTMVSAGAASGYGSANRVLAGPSAKELAAKPTKSAFAGYAAATTAVTSETATLTIPTFSCAKKTVVFQAVALVYDANLQDQSGAALDIGCLKRKEFIEALIQLDNNVSAPTATFNGGDNVEFSVTCGSGGESVSIDDTTNSSTVSSSSATANDCTEALVGDLGVLKNSSGTALFALPSFGSLDWTGVTIDAGSIGSLDPLFGNYYEGKKDVITTGSLTDGGTAFTTTQGT